ncbi:MAG: hypothetical protein HYY04_01895 [Chloroflexi bacterium]|nr:hypothetical protein [Chloroflexota bacterium]
MSTGPSSWTRVDPPPNFDYLRRVVRREAPPGRVPFAELFADQEIIDAVLGVGLTMLVAKSRRETGTTRTALDDSEVKLLCDSALRFCYEMGYDYVWGGGSSPFPRHNVQRIANTAPTTRERVWSLESVSEIGSWADFEAYPWPKPEDIDYRAAEYLGRNVPDGMQVIPIVGGPWEAARLLIGFVPLAYAVYDQPGLVEAVMQRAGDILTNYVSNLASIDGIGAIHLGEDMAFNGGPMLSPGYLRQHLMPQQARVVEAVHARGKLLLFHACGREESLMEDLIDYVGIDSIHSFEDMITPVEEIYRRFHGRVAVLGGVDVGLMCTGTEEEVRARTRQILDTCGPGGGYCVGSGNSVTNYVPVRSYLAMLDEGRRWNAEHS